MPSDFFIVDVFAERAYAGNPLAVVLGAERLDDDSMQLLAAETNYSETTFVYSDPEANGGFRTNRCHTGRYNWPYNTSRRPSYPTHDSTSSWRCAE